MMPYHLVALVSRAAESESEPESESVGVGVDKIDRLRSTPDKLLFPIYRNRHADYLRHFSAHILVEDCPDDA